MYADNEKYADDENGSGVAARAPEGIRRTELL
jgi:hypothetical protein